MCVYSWPMYDLDLWPIYMGGGVILMSFTHSFYLVFFSKKNSLLPRILQAYEGNSYDEWGRLYIWLRSTLKRLWKCIILPHFGKRGILFCTCQSVYGSSDVLSYILTPCLNVPLLDTMEASKEYMTPIDFQVTWSKVKSRSNCWWSLFNISWLLRWKVAKLQWMPPGSKWPLRILWSHSQRSSQDQMISLCWKVTKLGTVDARREKVFLIDFQVTWSKVFEKCC